MNRLMWGRPTAPRDMCRVRSISELEQGIGTGSLRYGEVGECSWEMAKILRRQGIVEIIDYDESLVQEPITESAETLDTLEYAGFFCEKCLRDGIVIRFANWYDWRGHQIGHSPILGRPKGTTSKPIQVEADNPKDRKRLYNNEYQRRRRHQERMAKERKKIMKQQEAEEKGKNVALDKKGSEKRGSGTGKIKVDERVRITPRAKSDKGSAAGRAD